MSPGSEMTPDMRSADRREGTAPSLRAVGRKLVVAYCIGALLLAALVAWTLERDLADRLAARVRQADTLARALEEHVDRTLENADHVIKNLVDDIGYYADGQALDVDAVTRILRSGVAGFLQGGRAVVYAADGTLFANTIQPGASGADTPPPHFFWHRDHADKGSHIGVPTLGPVTGKPVIPFTRRLHNRDGSFAGIAGMALDPHYFESFYASLGLEGGRITVSRDDGVILARYPAEPAAGAQSGAQSGAKKMLGATRHLATWPVLVAVETDAAPLYAGWRRDALRLVAGFALALLVSGLLLRALLQQLRRIDAGREELEVTKYTLDQTSDAVYWVDVNGRFAFANPQAARWFGIARELLVGSSVADVFPRYSPERFERAFARLRASGTIDSLTEYRNARGELRPAEAHASLLVCRGAEYACVVLRDLSERVAAERALRASEERYQAAVQGAEVGIWEWDLARDTTYLSPYYKKLLGYAQDELSDSRDSLLGPVVAADRERVQEELRNAIARGGRFVCEFRGQRKDGALRWFRASGAATRDASGNPVRVAGSLIDITASKEIELRLRASESRREVIFQRSPLGIVVTTRDGGVVVDANEAALAMTGYAREAFIGRDVAELGFWPSLDARARARALTTLPRMSEGPYRRKSGETIYVQRSVELAELDGESYLITSMQDITERRRKEDALRASEGRFASIMEMSPTAVVMAALDTGVTLDVNPAFTVVTGYAREDILGRSSSELGIWVETRDRGEYLRELLEHGRSAPREYAIRRKGGDIGYIVHTGVLIEFAGERRSLSFLQDITAHKRVERTLRRREELLRQTGAVAKVGGWELDPVTDTMEWTEEVFRIHELDVDGGVPSVQQAVRYYQKGSRRVLSEAIARAVQAGEPFDLELPFVTARGNERWVRTQGIAERRDGTTVRIYGAFQDITERRLQGEWLRQSEARFAKIFDSTPAGVVLFRVEDGYILDVNPALCRISGFGREELTRTTTAEFMRTFMLEPFDRVARITALKREGWVPPQDYAYRSKDGREGWMAMSTYLLDYAGEQLALAFMQDTTEQRQTQLELLRSRERFELVFHASPEAIAISGIDDAKFLDINDAWARMLGYARADVIGRTAFDLSLWVDPAVRERVVALVRDGETVRDVETRFRRASGEIIDVRCSYVAIELFDRAVMITTVADITQQKDAERRLSRSQDLMRRTGEVAHVGGWEIDIDTMVLQWDDEVCRIHDLAPGYVPSVDKAIEFYAPEARPVVRSAIERGMAEGSGWDLELPFITATGRRIWVRAQGIAEQRNGRTVRLYGAFQDITERRRAADEIRRLNETLEQRVRERTAQLEAANKELESFSYSVSHDLRAPLRAMTGFSTILMQDHASKLDSDARELLSRVAAASERMADLIDALLALSRVTRQQMQRTAVDLSAMARNIVQELRDAEPEREADIVIRDKLVVHADPLLMRSLLENLLGNAWKYSGRKPRVRVDFGCAVVNDERVFHVRDEGAGFDMRYAGRLFGAFQRLHSPKEFEGTGIGLATVERIVRRHGGRIWAEAEVDQGAAFYFTLG